MKSSFQKTIMKSHPRFYTENMQEEEEEDDEVEEEEEEKDGYALIPKPITADLFLFLITLQADAIYTTLVVLTSPIWFLYSLATGTYRRAKATTAAVESTVRRVPSNIRALLWKGYVGVLGVLHVSMVLVVLIILSFVLGVGLVRVFLEEPVVVKQRLFFDYRDANPNASFNFGENYREGLLKKGKDFGVPVGHMIHVSLVFLLPESEFNRQIGLFQVTAELLSTNGDLIAVSSQPWMLRFRSLPIRLTRTFLLGVPLLVGISSETQIITTDILRHKEQRRPRTRTIRITLSPKAGSSDLPQIYEAEISVMSQPPWNKRLIYNWKWTLYVWTSLYVYVVLLVATLCCCRRVMFPRSLSRSRTTNHGDRRKDIGREKPSGDVREVRDIGEEDVGEMIRRLRERRRRKRKAVSSSSAASSMSLRREYGEEEVGDSESVCLDD